MNPSIAILFGFTFKMALFSAFLGINPFKPHSAILVLENRLMLITSRTSILYLSNAELHLTKSQQTEYLYHANYSLGHYLKLASYFLKTIFYL